MIKVNPRFIYDEENQKTGTLLTIKDFDRIVEELEDFEDYKTIKERSGKKQKTFTSEEVLKKLFGKK